MPITPTTLTAGASTAVSTSYVTATYAPSSGQLILLTVGNITNQVGVEAVVPTVTGNGASWVQVVTATNSEPLGARQRLTVFRAMSTAVLLSGAATFSFGASTQEAVVWGITQFSGVSTLSTDGVDAIPQSNSTLGSTASSVVTVSMAPFGGSSNLSFGGFSFQAINPPTTGGGFQSLTVSSAAGVASYVHLTEFSTNDTSIDANFPLTARKKIGIGIEIKEAPADDFRLRRMMVGIGR